MAYQVGSKIYSRRSFVRSSSQAALLGAVGISFSPSKLRGTPNDLLENVLSLDDPELRNLTLQALDVAGSAGAEFADVRVHIGQSVNIGVNHGKAGSSGLGLTFTIGVRAVVNGAWGFAGGTDVTSKGVTKTAMLAVALAKAGRTRKPRNIELAPAPIVADGKWSTPIDRDPFTVPISEQEAYWEETCKYVVDSVPALKKYKASVKGGVQWLKSERIFASTEGSFIKQQVYHAYPLAAVYARQQDDQTWSDGVLVKELKRGGYGYESVSSVRNLKELWRDAAERAVARASTPVIVASAEIGRYDLVLSTGAVSKALLLTVGEALDLARARGDTINGQGSTYAMPPMDMLGKFKLSSSLLTITADRSRPHSSSTVGWDEEGVKPDEYTLIKDGIVMDYISTRRTAPALADWYKVKGEPLRSHGCATRSGMSEPALQVPNLTIAPSTDDITEEDLIKGVSRGFYVEELDDSSIDQQIINSQFSTEAIEIVNGKLGRRVRGMAVNFNTPRFWNSVGAIGGKSSIDRTEQGIDSYVPGNTPSVTVACSPVFVRDVNVIRADKRS